MDACASLDVARYRVHARLNRIAWRIGLAAAYHTPVGVKRANGLFLTPMIDLHVSGEPVLVEPDRLRLGWDVLRDRYTLLETTVGASPHFRWVRSLAESGAEPDHVYIERVARGTLDWQSPQPVSPDRVERTRRQVREWLERIDRAEPLLVRVAWIGGEPYLIDGKHRAATAHLRGVEVLCEDATAVYRDSYFTWISSVVSRRAAVHRIHLDFWRRVQRQLAIERERGS
jgi:hypothetical protein